ncbi:MAG: hypothetical protein MI867_23830 [Pseudomonadales bacterium]|nr:hypothetical protein [Pseudomonadales bacterium]
MAENTPFFGFKITEALYRRAGKHIDLVLANQINRQLVEDIAQNLLDITDTGLVAYYQKPRDLVDISPVVKKAADAGINAVMKGVHIVIRKVILKAPESELQKMALYMRSLLTADNQGNYFVTFPLTKELHDLAVELLAKVREDDNVDTYREDIVQALYRLIDAGIEAYYHQPVGMIQLGKLTKKTADVSMSTAQKGTNSVIRRIFKVLEHNEMLPLTNYFESLLHQDLVAYSSK